MKKVLLVGPIMSRSGYGEHARFVLDSLMSQPEKYDVYVHPLNWGKSSWSFDHDYKRKMYEFLIKKKESYGGPYDISIQVTIPNEFVEAAPINIGVTAGVETTTVPKEWILRCNAMNKLIVTSEFTKAGFTETEYSVEAQLNDETKSFKGVAIPVETVSYPIKDFEEKSIDDQLKDIATDFNFLCVSQLAPRKNIEQLLKCFVDEFRDNENIGLILKCHAENHSRKDKDFTEKMLYPAIKRHGDRKCKIYHIHGDMSEEEMRGLFTNKKVNAYYTTTFSEGFGLPIFDAVSVGMPIVAPKFSGYLDFIHIPKENKKGKITKEWCFEPIKVSIAEVPEHAVMPGIIEKDSKWGYPDYEKTRRALRNMYENYKAKKAVAKKLQEYALETFNRDTQLKKMCDAIESAYNNETENWKTEMNEVQVL